MTSSADQKAAKERAIFEEFAASVGLRVIPGSVQSQLPPAPDICCKIEGRGHVHFELVRLVDSAWAESIQKMLETRQMLVDHFANLQGDLLEAVRGLYWDAMIGVEFSPFSTLTGRRKVLPALVSHLIDYPEVGENLETQFNDSLRPTITRISIQRGLQDLSVDVPLAMNIEDPTLNTLNSKLHKGYTTEGFPLELLAYTDGVDLLFPDDVWLPKFEEEIKQKLLGSPFSAVWVYNASEEKPRRRLKFSTSKPE